MGGGREIVGIVGIVEIIEIALSSPKLATNKSCSWYLENGHKEGERKRSVGVCRVGKKIEIVEITLGDIEKHRERVGTVGQVG